MLKRNFSIFLLIFQILATNKSFSYVVVEDEAGLVEEELEYNDSLLNSFGSDDLEKILLVNEETEFNDLLPKSIDNDENTLLNTEIGQDDLQPVAREARSIQCDQSLLREQCRRHVIERLMSYFSWPSFKGTSNQADGVGEIYVHGEDILTNGITEVEGTVPILGTVSFSGPVKASGSVTIAGRCAPAGCSSLRIGQPLLVRSQPLLPLPIRPVDVPPIYSPAVEEILPIPIVPIEPDPLPTILPPVVIPAVVIPAYVLPEVVIPASELYALASGAGNVIVTGNDVRVNGITSVSGAVPTMGDVSFCGYVPAKGSVTICGHF